MKRITLVGNDEEITENQSDFIDDSDIVIRFNTCRNFKSGLVGSKTDVLVVRLGHNIKSHNFITGKTVNLQTLKDCSQLWVIGWDIEPISAFVYNAKYFIGAKELNTKTIFFIPQMKVQSNLNLKTGATCGVVILYYLLNWTDGISEWDKYLKYLAAFGFSKIPGVHDVDGEKVWVRNMVDCGKLRLTPGRSLWKKFA